MWTKQLGFREIILFLLFFMVLGPTLTVVADSNVFDCTKNPGECEEDGSLIENEEDEKNEQAPAVRITAWEYIKTGLALVFVVGLLVALLKFVNRKNRLYEKNRLMKNMGGISLGQHKSVQLVVVGEAYYLIGVGEDIRLLKEITDQDEIATLVEYYEEVEENEAAGWLNQLLTGISARTKGKTNERKEKKQDFSNVFNTRLDEIKEERKRHLSQMTEKERDQDD